MRWFAARVTALPPGRRDLVLAMVLVIVDVATLLPYRSALHPAGLAIALVVAQNLPLAWRSRWPALVLLVVGAARVSYDLASLGYAPLPLGPAIGYYTVMSQCSPRVRQIISVLVLASIATSQSVPGHNEPYDFAVAVLIFAAAGTAGVLSRGYAAQVRARLASVESQRDLEVAAAAARERSRIARELHDVVAHHVSLMAVQAEAAASLLPDHPVEASRSADVIADTARQALSELRRLLGVLRGPDEQVQTTPSPSLANLDSALDQVRRTGLSVDLHVEGIPCALAAGIDLTAYRIIQEALTNTIRHSPAVCADVTLSYEPGYVTVSVADSGQPSAPLTTNGGDPMATRPTQAPGGFGLAGITERVTSCGGSLSVGPTGSGGFLVRVRLPTQ